MYLTVNVEFKYPNRFEVTIDQIPNFKYKYNKLEDIYKYLREHKNMYLESTLETVNENLYFILRNDFKYRYIFTNPYGDKIEIIPDNKLSTKQLFFLYEFDIENNSQVIIRCTDNQIQKDELAKQFESAKQKLNNSDDNLFYSNIL